MSLTLGQAIWASVKPIIKIYLILGCGFLLARVDVLTVEGTKCISNIVLTLLLPCLSFNKIVGNIEDQDIKQVGIVCLSAVLIFLTGLFFAYVVRLVLPVPKQWQGGILAGGMFPNISDLPIAYLQTLDQGLVFTQEEGNKGVANVIIFLAMFLIVVFNLGGFRLIEMDFKYNDQESARPEEDYEITDKHEKRTRSSSIMAPEAAHTSDLPTYQSSLASITPQESQAESSTATPCSHDRRPLPFNGESKVTNRRRTSNSSSFRTQDAREAQHPDMAHLIREYSNVDQFGRRRSTASHSQQGLSRQPSVIERIKTSDLTRMVTSEAGVGTQDVEDSGKSLPPWLYKLSPTRYVVFFLKNCLRPCSMAVIIALIIAFVPWLKALFVTDSNTPKIKQAPDAQPALSFFMDFTSYIGAASVPFGLLLLGATLGRLKITKLYPGFWKSALVLVLLRLCLMPVLGVLWCDRLVKSGLLNWEDDAMLLFVIAIDWALPSMTTQIYFTASYTPTNAIETIQLDCTSFFLMIQYPIMAITLPILVTYFLKVQMKV
ncbi:LANO_0H08702g1_1 [Lachancea nothofagi CBS 11611]|uniref:LANO_0H08702g1_1 n=1 Tax=Lachancea nothofagi CBS 11611 TaxID=1266666 RepID=A0A1G4KLP1_9SACH|nr:LANO_0H08702g1_1 [Lachancea nothofagi CBS 11611]